MPNTPSDIIDPTPSQVVSPAPIPAEAPKPPKPVTRRKFGDIHAIKNLIYDNVLNEASNVKPAVNTRFKLSLHDLHYADPGEFSKQQQKEAILGNKTLSRRLRGTWRLSDVNTGDVVDEKKMTVAQVPHLNTGKGTFIINGTEYALGSQLRLLPGVYTRVKDNGEIEAHVNVIPGKGVSHRYFFEPDTGLFKINIGQSKMPLMPVLHAMGVPDSKIRDAWGPELFAANKQHDSPHIIDKLYQRMVRKADKNAPHETKAQSLTTEFANMEFDPDVNLRTLGHPHKNMSSDALLATTKKLLAVNKHEAEPDDRDHLAFQRLMGPEDLLAERIAKDRSTMNTMLWQATAKGSLGHVQPGAFSKAVMAAFLTSGLGQAAEEVNAAEFVDHHGKVSRLGEGGIGDAHNIPMSSRAVSPSQLGFIDSIRSPECHMQRTKVMTKNGWVDWSIVDANTEFACLISEHVEYHKAEHLFCGDYEGAAYRATNKRIEYMVTPNHRLWRSTFHGAKWKFELASDAHDKKNRFKVAHKPYITTNCISRYTIPGLDSVQQGLAKVIKKDQLLPVSVDINDWAEFMGWYISEGCVRYQKNKHNNNYAANCDISQSKNKNPDNYTRIALLLARLPFAWTKQGNQKGFVLNDRRLAAHLSQYGYAYDKWIPDYLFELSLDARQRLFTALLLGDGRDGSNPGYKQFCTSSKKLADGFIKLAFDLGYSTSISIEPEERKQKDGSDNLDMTIVNVHQSTTRVFTDSKQAKYRNKQSNYSIEHYKGKVYCAQVPGGLLYTKIGNKGGIWLGNSFRAGVDLRVAYGVQKGSDGKMYAPFVDVKRPDKFVFKTPQQVLDSVIAFPGELQTANRFVRVMHKGQMKYIDRSKVDLALDNMEAAFSPLSNMVPMKSGVKGQRVAMGARMLTQALPLVDAEAPHLQSATPYKLPDGSNLSFEHLYGTYMGIASAPKPGTVLSVTPTNIKVKYDDGSLDNHELHLDMPNNRKSASGKSLCQIKRTDNSVFEVTLESYQYQVGDQVLSIDPVTHKSCWALITGYKEIENDKQLYKITTRSRRTITVTEDHSLITMGDDGRLKPILPKDCVVSDTMIPIAMLPPPTTKSGDSRDTYEYGLLAGLYLAEGSCQSYPNSGPIQIAVMPKDRAAQIVDLFSKLGIKAGQRSGAVRAHHLPTQRWLANTFGRYSYGKFISAKIYGWSDEFRVGLIRGYMSGDGNLWADTFGNIQMTAVSVSERLINCLMTMFSTFDIFTAKFDAPRTHINDNWNDAFGCRIVSGDLHKLPGSKWFFYDDRQAKFDRIFKDKRRSSQYGRVPVPKAARKLLYSGFKEVGLKPDKFILKTVYGNVLAKHRVTHIAGPFGLWANSNVCWDEITSITKAPHEKYVYDLEVFGNENFAVNNGWVIHNTFLHNTPLVKPGDKFNVGDVLAKSNYTDKNGTAALGLNVRIGYLPFRGMTYEDAVVISESMAKRATSEHMYQHTAEFNDKTHRGKRAFISLFPTEYDRKTLDRMDDNGVVKPGSVVNYGDPLILMATEKERAHNQVHRSSKGNQSNSSVLWKHHAPGQVTDIVHTRSGALVAVKAYVPTEVGDKLCCDPQTEVLTKSGWKKIQYVTQEDDVATIQQHNSLLEFQKPTHLHAYHHVGDMYYVNNACLNMLVTPNHKLWIRPETVGATAHKVFRFVTAQDVCDNHDNCTYRCKNTVKYIGEHKDVLSIGDRTIQTNDWFKLISYYNAFGVCQNTTVKGKKRVIIYQARTSNVYRDIQSLLTRLNLTFKHARNDKYRDRFIIHDEWLFDELKPLGTAKSRRLPANIKELSAKQIHTFLHNYAENVSDKSYNVVFASKSKKLIDDYQDLAMRLGSFTAISRGFHNNKQLWFGRMSARVGLTNPTIRKLENADDVGNKSQMIPYSGMVYCVTVPNHTIVTRRKDKIVITGNSGRYGDKGVVSGIIPDEQMPHAEDGKPLEILVSPAGVISRINSAQIVEAALGKIAAKTGVPYKYEDFKPGSNITQYALDELKKHGMKDTETVTDPLTGRKIPDVLVGNRFFMKLHHTSECFDAKTEVLTDKGWVQWPNVTEEHLLATIDGDKHIFEKPLGLVSYHYAGDMYTFSHGSLDYCVTPKHRLYVKGLRKSQEFEFKFAYLAHGDRFLLLQYDFDPENITDVPPRWSVKDPPTSRFTKADGNILRSAFQIITYSGMVYCATMRTGLLYTRRNSKPMLSGNSKGQGRGAGGGYDVTGVPSKGGETGSKRLSLADSSALLAHGSLDVLSDAHLVRGSRNEDYWMRFLAGQTPPTPGEPVIYKKFLEELKSAGVNVIRDGHKLNIMALTDKDIAKLTQGREIRNHETVDWKAGLKEIPGGFFGKDTTGGHGSTNWSSIKLHEPMVSPAMEEPARRLLNLTEAEFLDVLSGKKPLNNLTGPKAIETALTKIDIKKEIANAQSDIASGKKSYRDAAVKKLQYLKAAEKLNIHPKDWIWHSVPVLPPVFRQISVMQGKRGQIIPDPNFLYKEVWDANNVLKDLSKQVDDVSEERLNLYNSIKAVTGLGDPIQPKHQEKGVKGILQHIFGSSSKLGAVQFRLLGASVNLVGRGVITPNPDMDMDHIGIPEEKAWEVFKQFIVRGLVRSGMPRIRALQEVDNKGKAARDMLVKVMDDRPVLVNRYPILHKYGLMAFWPRLVKGNTMQVSPIVTKQFRSRLQPVILC